MKTPTAASSKFKTADGVPAPFVAANPDDLYEATLAWQAWDKAMRKFEKAHPELAEECWLARSKSIVPDEPWELAKERI